MDEVLGWALSCTEHEWIFNLLVAFCSNKAPILYIMSMDRLGAQDHLIPLKILSNSQRTCSLAGVCLSKVAILLRGLAMRRSSPPTYAAIPPQRRSSCIKILCLLSSMQEWLSANCLLWSHVGTNAPVSCKDNQRWMMHQEIPEHKHFELTLSSLFMYVYSWYQLIVALLYSLGSSRYPWKWTWQSQPPRIRLVNTHVGSIGDALGLVAPIFHEASGKYTINILISTSAWSSVEDEL